MAESSEPPAAFTEAVREIWHLQQRIGNTPTPDSNDMRRLRTLLADTPVILEDMHSTSISLRQEIMSQITQGVSRAYLEAEQDVLKREFNYYKAPPMEKLLIDQIMTARIRLIYAERAYSQAITQKEIVQADASFFDKMLSSAQQRYVNAIKALAQVRKLSKDTPALYLNIAEKQMNLFAGSGESLTRSPDSASLPDH